MIPVKLTIEGLYSYQKSQTIDFKELTSAGLFGIFGGVGSGKSTILEAITFAVYGRTDRLNLSGDNRYYNMMNLKSDSLLIDFIFETGKNQTAYRSIVRGKRNNKRFEDVRTLDRTAYQLIDNQWVSVEPAALETAIGLSYENFKRTIIIPQGQFQEFLQLGNKDRTQMMKDLFNLGKYDFYYKVVSVEGKNNEKKQNIEGKLQQLGTLDPAHIELYNRQLQQIEADLKEINSKLNQLQTNEERLRNLQETVRKRDIAEKEFKALTNQKEYFKQLEKRVAEYENCVVTFKHLLDTINENSEKIKQRDESVKSDSKKSTSYDEEIKQLDKQLDLITPKYEKREELKKRYDELSTLLNIINLESIVKSENERVENGTIFWEETSKKSDSLKVTIKSHETELKVLRESIPDHSLLTNINMWHINKRDLIRQLNETNKEIDNYTSLDKQIEKLKTEILNSSIFEKHTAQNEDYNELLTYLETEYEKAKRESEQLNNREKHLLVKDKLKSFAEGLTDDTPCPLCGSLHHPELFKSDDISAELFNINKERRAIEDMLSQINTLSKELSIIENRRLDNNKQLYNYIEKKEIILTQIEQHNNKFVWDKYKNEEELTNALKIFEETQLIIKDKEKSLQTLSSDLSNEESKRDRAKLKLEEISKSLTIHQTELQTLQGQLRIINRNNYKDISEVSVENEKEYLLKEYNTIETEYYNSNKQLMSLKRENDILLGRLEANKKELESDLQKQESLENKLNQELIKSDYSSVDQVKAILREKIDTATEKSRISEYNNLLMQSQLTLNQLVKEIGNDVYEQKLHQETINEIAAVKDEIELKNRDQGKINELRKTLQKNLETEAELQKELSMLDIRAENIKTLKSLFKASGFVNYISSVYLQNLCNSANERFFKLTRQKLSLEITPDNNFQVRDFMNGGKVRSVKTLSGGQTFQASLSLALALADNIQKITQSNQNFFFLDEGFGSLDKESLDIVFDTLKSLRKENRIVGVISHVEEMQQEIETHLRIVNNEESGSIIYRSWEV